MKRVLWGLAALITLGLWGWRLMGAERIDSSTLPRLITEVHSPLGRASLLLELRRLTREAMSEALGAARPSAESPWAASTLFYAQLELDPTQVDKVTIESAAFDSCAADALAGARLAHADPSGTAATRDQLQEIIARQDPRSLETLECRLLLARALHRFGDPRGLDAILVALGNAESTHLATLLAAEFRQVSGVALVGEHARFLRYWQGARDDFASAGRMPAQLTPTFQLGTIVLVVAAAASYLVTIIVRRERRFASPVGMIGLATAGYALGRDRIVASLEAWGVPWTPIAMHQVDLMLDSVVLPYHLLLFTLLALAAGSRSSSTPP